MNTHNNETLDLISTTSTRSAQGRLTALLVKWLFRQATVSKVELLSENFRRITLAGDDLKGIVWTPGQKIQINFGGDATRTYTPTSWDPITGETSIIAFLHGKGPGSSWASSVQQGAACPFFGPRRSIDLKRSLVGRPLVFGDETSFASALTFTASTSQTEDVALLFEVTSVEESRKVWQACSAWPAHFIARKSGDAHLDEIEVLMLRLVDDWSPDRYILIGKASSIQRGRRVLKTRGIDSAKVETKAYWAHGKTGLD